MAAEHNLALRRLHEALEISSRSAGWPTEASYDGEPVRRARGGCGKIVLAAALIFLLLFFLGPLLLGSAVLRFFF